MTASFKNGFNNFRIYINGFIHVSLRKAGLIGIQSWIEGYGEDATYHIEYVYEDGANIQSEFWDVKHWQEVLKVLDTEDIFR